MRPRKGSGAERLGIKFTGNPDARDHCELGNNPFANILAPVTVERIVSKPILLCGDCLEIMRTGPAEIIDLTVTSPPYDNLRTYNGNNVQWGEHVWKQVISELYRVTKQGGVVVWVVGDATVKGSETGTSFKQALWAMEFRKRCR